MKLTAFLAATLLGTTAMAQSAAAPAAPAWTFALHGFVSMSAAYQDGAFGLSEGQQSLLSTTKAAGPATIPDANTLTFDVRQSRFNFSVKGPQVLGGATPTGVLEIDFFQGFGGGAYGDVSLLNRMRLAYSELNWGAARLQFGQQNDLVFAMAPTSLSHIAFPLGYDTGNLGWRRPGVFGYYTFTAAPDVKIELAGEVGRSQWNDAAACTVANGTATNPANPVTCTATIGGGAANGNGGFNLGEASASPAVEGRVSLAYAKFLNAFVGAHWNNVDLTGYGAQGILPGNNGAVPLQTPVGSTHSLSVTAYNAGLKVSVPLPNDMGLVLQGTGFYGKNVGPLIAQLVTFNIATDPTDPNKLEDVRTIGWWAQAGFNLTKELALWGFYGMQSINKTDFAHAAYGANKAYENATTNVQLIYRDGGYGLSAEWINFATKYSGTGTTATAGIQNSRTSNSNQYMLTANYFF